MNKTVIAALLAIIVVFVVSCTNSPDMKIGYYNRLPQDMIEPDYRNGNEYDSQLMLATEEVLKDNKGFAFKPYTFLIRGKRPQKYSFKEYKATHPDDLVIEYSNGRKLAIYTNNLPTPDMKEWNIAWDPDPPKIPQRINR